MAKRRKSTKKSKKTKSQTGAGIIVKMSRPRTRPFIARRAKGVRPVVIDQKGGFLGPLIAGLMGLAASTIPALIKKKK